MRKKVFVHPTAEVSYNAKIGDGTKIWNNVQVREFAIIGKNCNIGKDCYIDNKVKIGDRCKIQNGSYIYWGVTIEDDVFIGPNVTFTNDKIPRAFNTDWKPMKTLVRKGASIGAGSVIVCGITIGEYAMVGAGAVVVDDVLPYTLVLGVPAKFYSYIDKMGRKISKEEYERLVNETQNKKK